MNYELIADESKLLTFLDILPETLPDECYYLSLLARNKWVRDQPADRQTNAV